MFAKFYEASKCSSLSLFQYSKSSTCFLPSILSTFRWGDLNSMKHYSSPHTHWLEALIFSFKKTNEYTLVDTIFQNMAPMEISNYNKKKALGCERIGNSWYSREKKKKNNMVLKVRGQVSSPEQQNCGQATAFFSGPPFLSYKMKVWSDDLRDVLQL